MKSDSKAICDGKMYVKTDFTYNGNNDYKLSKAEGVISGASDLNTLKGYSEYKILVSLNTNISVLSLLKKIAKEVLKKNILIMTTLSVVQYLTLKTRKCQLMSRI